MQGFLCRLLDTSPPHYVKILFAAIAIQVLIVLTARREIAHSETYIYILFFSVALSSLFAYITLKSRFENRSLRTVTAGSLKLAAMGMLCGGMYAATCTISFVLSENVEIYVNAVSGQALVKFCVISLLPAILEEAIFRGALLNLIHKATNRFGSKSIIIANAIQALVFSATHFHTTKFEDTFYPLFAFTMGFALGHFAIKTRSLWFPMGLHLAWNFSNYLLFGIHKKIMAAESGIFSGNYNGAKFIAISLFIGILALGALIISQRHVNSSLRENGR
jgi:membrane protease YdiL (CAAX protease family)